VWNKISMKPWSKSYREESEYRRRRNSNTDRRAQWTRESARF
jgi:hypothetical protein